MNDDIVAIICEYNPFHNGHEYHLDTAKKLSGASSVVCIMSGDFTQRAEPAVISQFERAKIALTAGADAVIALPTVYATGSGATFAFGGVKIATQIKNVKYLAFGCEDNNPTALKAIAEVQVSEPKILRDELYLQLNGGASYATAYTSATVKALPNIDGVQEILTKPNNLLAIEYLKNLIKLNSDVKPIFITRKGAGYNETVRHQEFISATLARELLCKNDYTALSAYMPEYAINVTREEIESHPVRYDVFESLTVNALRQANLSELYDCIEGLDVKLHKNAVNYCSLQKIIAETKSKRYTLSRIRRLCLQALLNIKKDALDVFPTPRLLAVKQTFKARIGELNCAVQNTELSDAHDLTASRIYSLITNSDGDKYYNTKLIIQ